jgi:hypothetical protein
MSPAEELEAALSATAQALEAGDPRSAERASERASAASRDLEAVGRRLGPESLARLVALQRRCEQATRPVQERLGGELKLAARSARATLAYARRARP